MPTYDFICPQGHEQSDVMVAYGTRPACPECQGPTEILWKRSFPAIHGDEMDYVEHNMTTKPIHFRSKSERKRVMKQLGLVEKVRHVGMPGSDKSPHTRMWQTMDPQTMANAKALLDRQAKCS